MTWRNSYHGSSSDHVKSNIFWLFFFFTPSWMKAVTPIRMNGHARTVYSAFSRVCDLFFSDHVRLYAVSC